MKAIAFIGDSFCNTYGNDEIKKAQKAGKCTLWQGSTADPTYTDIVAKSKGYTLYPYGFGGKSWWYSRQRFMEDLNKISENSFADNLEFIVFCHTDSSRINNAWNTTLSASNNSREFENYYRYMFDNKFHQWAQQRWFEEINEQWGHLKTIHFHCFPETVPMSHMLPGIVYTTPLIWISIGELQGTDQEVDYVVKNDYRHNHLNEKNNQALAEVILGDMHNYNPGIKELDLSKFDMPNQNAILWPNPGHGTKK